MIKGEYFFKKILLVRKGWGIACGTCIQKGAKNAFLFGRKKGDVP